MAVTFSGPSTSAGLTLTTPERQASGTEADAEDSDDDNILVSEPIDSVTTNGDLDASQRHEVQVKAKKSVRFEDVCQ